MIGRLLFGPRWDDDGSQILVRGQVINIDLVVDLLHLLQTRLPGLDIHLSTIANWRMIAVSPDDLGTLTGSERLGLLIQGGQDRDHLSVPLGLDNVHIRLGPAEARPVVQDALKMMFERSRPVFRWRRVLALVPTLLAAVAVVTWVGAVWTGQAHAAPLVALTAAVVLLLVVLIAARWTVRLLHELDRFPVAHRFEPVSYREIANGRANRRRDVLSGVIGAAGALLVAVVLYFLGIKP